MPGQAVFGYKSTKVTLADYEQVFVAASGSVFVANDVGIQATGSGNTINVLGSVYAGGIAVKMGDTTGMDGNNRLFIGETGYINGSATDYAISMTGSNSVIENAGTVWNKNNNGKGIGVINGDATSDTRIINSGTIDVSSAGITFFHIGNAHLENTGTIKGSTAIIGNTGAINIKNSGEILGEVVLSTADDFLDNRSGKIVGVVNAWQGNDILYGGKGVDHFYGELGDDKLYGYGGNDTLDGYTGNDTLMGGDGNDELGGDTGNDLLNGEAGTDFIYGGDGNDKIYGGAGNDTIGGGRDLDQLSGGTGADLFIFVDMQDTGATKATADTINDFEKVDYIFLFLIDANTKHAGDDKFSFIGTQAFHGKAGELRYEKLASDTYIYGDTNGDKKADLVIHLDDAVTMKAEYFVL